MNSLLSRFESINPFSTKSAESYIVGVVEECNGLRVGTIAEAIGNLAQSVPVASIDFDNPTGLAAAIENPKPKMVVENLATVAPSPAINFSNPSIDLGSAPVKPEVAPSQQLSDEEQKRANLLAAYAEIDGTTQQDTQSILRG